jgi:hypothetical protein
MKTYQSFDPTKGYPAGSNLFYECLKCGEVVPSYPKDDTGCKCGNIAIDVSGARMFVQDHGQIKLFSLTK